MMDKTNKTKFVNVRVTKQERQIIEELASQEVLTIGELVRQLVRNEARKQGIWPPIEKQIDA